MARFLFPEWTQPLKKYVITPALLLGPVYIVALAAVVKDPQTLRIGYMPNQPVPYSHALHVGELGMDPSAWLRWRMLARPQVIDLSDLPVEAVMPALPVIPVMPEDGVGE